MTSDDRDPTSVAEPDEAGPRSSSRLRPTPSPRRADRAKPKKKHLPVWQETLLLLGIALVLAIVIKAFFVQAFYIPSESMEPGLVKNDRILVQKVSYWFGGSPERGDVVVFEDPGGWLDARRVGRPHQRRGQGCSPRSGSIPTGGHLVKRVIGVAGDVITCCDEQGRILVNGQPLDEKQLRPTRRRRVLRPDDRQLRLDGRPGPRGPHLRDGRQPQQLRRLHRAHVPADRRDRLHARTRTSTSTSSSARCSSLLWPRDRFAFVHRPDTFADVPDAS